MVIFGKEVKTIIFDMDGTLIDSTSIWIDIDKEFFAKRGISEVPKDYAQKIVHMGLIKGAEMTIETYGFKNDTVEGVIKEWEDASFEAYKNSIPLKPFAVECLQYLKDKGIKLALATANNEKLYKPCLERLGIEKYFDIVTDVSLAKEGKSSPKIYESIAEQFNVKKEETMVVEDTIVGLKTANDNGFIAIGIDDKASRNIEEEKINNCYKYIYSLKEFFE